MATNQLCHVPLHSFPCWAREFIWSPLYLPKSWVRKPGVQTSPLGLPFPELLMLPCDGGSAISSVADTMADGYWDTACLCQEDMDTMSLLSNNWTLHEDTLWGFISVCKSWAGLSKYFLHSGQLIYISSDQRSCCFWRFSVFFLFFSFFWDLVFSGLIFWISAFECFLVGGTYRILSYM